MDLNCYVYYKKITVGNMRRRAQGLKALTASLQSQMPRGEGREQGVVTILGGGEGLKTVVED